MKKGFAAWLEEEQPDIIALQEIKATEDVVETLPFLKLGYELYWLHDRVATSRGRIARAWTLGYSYSCFTLEEGLIDATSNFARRA